MQLSVIIVNYNVRLFLEQCLCSVQKAIALLPSAEIIVIDNHSPDNSIEWLKPQFPTVQFVENNENLGFAKACNQGWRMAKGEYILFLNPDTIVPEDCFQQCIAFFESHEKAGALGIRMLDGSGKFLQESKRSFPSPVTSLYKLFGLSKLFPRSAIFSKYHLGNLDEHANHEVDVLAGAFMMIKREALEKTGAFDEAFFMYGEDVDLSYRIQQAGYSNYYFAGSSILHFKGESTRKGGLNYVRMFYKAMSLFVKKHYGGSRAGIFNVFVHAAIWIRAAMAAVAAFIRRAGLPIIDAGLMLLSFGLVKNAWNLYVRKDIHYENRLLWTAFPVFTLVYLIAAYYAGLYDRWYKRSELVRSTLVATIVLLAGYSLLPEEYRFSRGIIFFGALLGLALMSLLRWVLNSYEVLNSPKEKTGHSDTLIVASEKEYAVATQLMKQAGLQEKILGRIAVSDNDPGAIGNWKNLPAISKTVPFREIIFCEGVLSFKNIFESIEQMPGGTRLKFHAACSGSIAGSDSRNSAGETLSPEKGYGISNPFNQRLKRMIDVMAALFALISFPVHFFTVKKPLSFFSNCFLILFMQRTWVGYATETMQLPRLRRAVIASNGIPVQENQSLPAESLRVMDYCYARDYEPANDLSILLRSYRRLGG